MKAMGGHDCKGQAKARVTALVGHIKVQDGLRVHLADAEPMVAARVGRVRGVRAYFF